MARLIKLLVLAVFLLAPAVGLAADDFAFSPVLNNAAGFVTLGTSSAGCAANGSTTSSTALTAGKWLAVVNSETVAICTDTTCSSAPLAFVPGTQLVIRVDSMQATTWYCRSAGATGYVTLFKLN